MYALIQWRGEDPTALAWGCALAYILAGVFCIWVGRRNRSGQRQPAADASLWVMLGAVLVLLGVNKEADLQTFVVHLGRAGAHFFGVYPYKNYIGAAFFVVVTLGCVVGLWRWRRRLQAFAGAHPVVIAGLALIGVYTLTRFATIVHLGPQWFIGLKQMPAFLAVELSGNLLILGAAVHALRTSASAAGQNAST